MKIFFTLIGVGVLLFIGSLIAGVTMAKAKLKPMLEKAQAERREKAAAAVAEAAEAAARAHAALRRPDPLESNPEQLKRVARELERWSTELRSREADLRRREAEVDARERAAVAERQAVERRKEEVQALQKEIGERLVLIDRQETQKLGATTEYLNAMKPEQVVEILRQQPDSHNAKLLSLMKNKRVVKLMEAWKSQFPDDKERVVALFQKMQQVMDAEAVSPPGAGS